MSRELIASYTRKDFRVDTFCTGGPGGQNQNRKRNGVRFTHLPTGLSAECRVHKRYEQNRKEAFQKLGRLVGAWHQEQITVAKVRSQEVVRSYHEPDNRVTDPASGLQMSYGEAMHKGIDRLIVERRKALA